MPFNTELADRLRDYLKGFPAIQFQEKKMFGGLAFMVNDKMCINVSGDSLMCRFDPALEAKISTMKGYEKMIMKGRELKGYCYIEPLGFKAKKDFEYLINICLDYNDKAKSSKVKK